MSMGEGRGKLEFLIKDLENKKSELEQLIKEYEVMLPHLSNARKALDEAGIAEPDTSEEAVEEEPAATGKAKAKTKAAAAEEAGDAEGEPQRRSIASLVAEEEAAADAATH